MDVLRWKFTSHPEPSPNVVDDVRPTVPALEVHGQEVLVTLVNHSTVLLQHKGLNILTDPIWSERASPVSFAGPKRHRIPGIRFEDLPPIHLVLLSHNHYDHIDLPTLRRLSREHNPDFVVPLRVAQLLASQNIRVTLELDWDQSACVRGCTIHCVPAVHFSARGLFDRDKTLWCGYVIPTPSGPIYFAGDTAWGDHFGRIAAEHGAPRLALLPIGAYLPRWFMSAVHMDPDQAMRAHAEMNSQISAAIHHGTFRLTDESLDSPAQELAKVLGPNPAVPPFVILKNGDSLRV